MTCINLVYLFLYYLRPAFLFIPEVFFPVAQKHPQISVRILIEQSKYVNKTHLPKDPNGSSEASIVMTALVKDPSKAPPVV